MYPEKFHGMGWDEGCCGADRYKHRREGGPICRREELERTIISGISRIYLIGYSNYVLSASVCFVRRSVTQLSGGFCSMRVEIKLLLYLAKEIMWLRERERERETLILTPSFSSADSTSVQRRRCRRHLNREMGEGNAATTKTTVQQT